MFVQISQRSPAFSVSWCYVLFWFALSCSIASSVLALTTDKMTLTRLNTNKITTNNTQIEQAQHWQLTLKEWTHYQNLMQGPAGWWYGKLDPPEVLGLLAKNDDERNHYADLVVRQRKARIDRELAFNRAVQAAWLRQYPHLKPIRAFDARAFQIKKRH